MENSSSINKEPLLEMFVFEINQLMEQLEEILLVSEQNSFFSTEDINEIFRIMHTVKGSSAMMMFNDISLLSHTLEDLFYFIRENSPSDVDYSLICDLVLTSVDFIKLEISKIQEGKASDGSSEDILSRIKAYLFQISERQKVKKDIELNEEASSIGDRFVNLTENNIGEGKRYIARVIFEDGCLMENIRAFEIINSLKDVCQDIHYIPEDIMSNSSSDYIIENGFTTDFLSEADVGDLRRIFEEALFIKSYELSLLDSVRDQISSFFEEEGNESGLKEEKDECQNRHDLNESTSRNIKQSLISINTKKLDKLMDLVGEIVITESMVTGNSDLKNLVLDSFSKASRQLRKLTDELQDTVMSMRLISIGVTFQKMHRIVRDMSKKLNKDVELIIKGEDTEVDKNIIDHLSDPLMHLIRNAMDHGIEEDEERAKAGKNQRGSIILEAKETGGEVVITVTDDGRGLDKDKILDKAREKGLAATSNHEYSEREIYSFIMLPGFSTNEEVTEYSGRGVGMDVVKKNIEQVGGNIFIDSSIGKGTSIMIKIPLTLAIIDGMEFATGNSIYTVSTTSIRECFKPDETNIVKDGQGNEMIMIRGSCYPVIRVHRLFNVDTQIQSLCDGIMIMVEGNEKTVCLFVDRLLGEQQVVVKPLPPYLMKYSVKKTGVAGCTILGDGKISLILDVGEIIGRVI